MADTFKILAQVIPSASVSTNLYTVPPLTSTTVSSLSVCNLGNETTFCVSVSSGGASLENKQYVYYNLILKAQDTFVATIGITLGASDVIRVFTPGSVAFNLFGVEVS